MNTAEINKSVSNSFKKFFEINHNLALSLAQQQLELVTIYAESGIKQGQILSAEVKPAQEIFTVQSKIAKEFNKQLLNNSRVTLEILSDTKKQFSGWAESAVQQVQDLNPLLATKKG
ncbi:MAG: phasin family protein [Thiotrichaceae bacterium]|nr:phasin family protein [Thiotrichaceae bacterium]